MNIPHKPSRSSILLTAALVLSAPLAAAAQDSLPPSPYYPLKVGAAWHYKANTGKVVAKVIAHEKVGDVLCARLEAADKGEKKVEYIAVQADGLYRHKVGDKELKPPLCLFKLPPEKGQTWKVDSEVGGVKIRGNFTVEEEEVTVPAGKYKAFKVTSKDYSIGGRDLVLAYWFVRDVGIVKQRVEVSGVKLQLELEKFEVGK